MATADAATSLAEEFPVRKALGLFTCTGFVALGLWLFLPADTPRNLSAQTAAVSPSGQSGPTGKRATRSLTELDLAPAPRTSGSAEVTVGTASASGGALTSSSILKLRVRDQLDMAQRAMDRGDRSEALRLAETAERIARSSGLEFGVGETTPGQFLASLRPVERDDPALQLSDLIFRARQAGTSGSLAEALNLAAQADRLAREHKLPVAPGTPKPSLLVAAYEVKLLEKSSGLKGGSLAKLLEVRVRDYMVVATKQEAAGRSEEALRLATVADLIARHQKLTFARGEITRATDRSDRGRSSQRPPGDSSGDVSGNGDSGPR